MFSMASLFEGGARQRAEKDICELKQTKHDELRAVLIMFHVIAFYAPSYIVNSMCGKVGQGGKSHKGGRGDCLVE